MRTTLKALKDHEAGRSTSGGRGAAMHAQQYASDPRLAAFSANIKSAYAAIQNNRDKFRIVPVGPIGMEISLDDRNNKWCAELKLVLCMLRAHFFV